MRLTYKNVEGGRGKTSDSADEVEVCLTKLIDAKLFEQAVTFESDNPEFSGVMRMTWTLDPVNNGTLVTIRAEGVPKEIRPEDHRAGMNSTLDNFVFSHRKVKRNIIPRTSCKAERRRCG